jgi:hypothetical protein
LPPTPYLTWEFIRGVLDGSKKLIRVKDLATLYEVPRFGNFSVSRLWEQIRNDNELMRYFPTSSKKYPTKLFTLNVSLKLIRY